MKFFEITCRSVTDFVPELSNKNAAKNGQRNFSDPMASEMSFSLRTWNWTNFGGNVNLGQRSIIAKFEKDPNHIFKKNQS